MGRRRRSAAVEQEDNMEQVAQELVVRRGSHRIYAEVMPGSGVPIVLMHGFPDNMHLYDRLLPYVAGDRPVVRFDFLGWGRSDKPVGYAYTAANQVGDIDAVIDAVDAQLGGGRLVLVAHDASGPPAIDWALAHPERIATLVLLNTYYHWTPVLRRPPAIALYSTPLVGTVARRMAARRPDINRRLYMWQVGRFIQDPDVRDQLVPLLYGEFVAAQPAFMRLNEDLIPTVLRRRRRVAQLRQFEPPVRIVFGSLDRYLNPRVALQFAALFPNSELHLVDRAGHYVQVDEPERVADLILR
jgi:pimeloyl-ACP methyl ester carboxylesterase